MSSLDISSSSSSYQSRRWYKGFSFQELNTIVITQPLFPSFILSTNRFDEIIKITNFRSNVYFFYFKISYYKML